MKTCGSDAVFTDSAVSGLAKREYFAAMALQGLLAYPIAARADQLVKASVEYADALIDELNKEPAK